MRTEAKEQYLPAQIQEYLNLLRNSAWQIGLVTLAITLAAVVVITFLPDEYRATTTILVDPQKIPDRYVTSTVPADPTERLNTITQQVLSATRLGDLIEQMGLYPEMKGQPREDVIEKMRKHIDLQVKHSSGGGSLGAFTITYEGPKAETVASVANRMAGSFINWNLKNREERAEDTTRFMSAQLGEAKQNLQDQEERLRQFKMSHVGEMPEQAQANLQTLTRLQGTLQTNSDALNRLEQEKQMLLRAPEPAAPVAPAQLTPRGRLEQEIQQLNYQLWDLKKKYTESHPDVIAAEVRLKQARAQLAALPPPPPGAEVKETSSSKVRLDLIEKEKQRLLGEQSRIQAQLQSYQSKVDAVPLREQQLSELTRDYEISKEHYSSLLEKTFSAEMATELERRQQGERFTVLDQARPPDRPFKPRRLLLIFGSLIGSLGFAVGLVLVRDMFSGTIKAERELKSLLPSAVSFLGSVPLIETNFDRLRLRRLHWFAVAASLMACAVVAVILWKVHPIL